MNKPFSVLLSVYYKESPDFLIQSLNSVFNQSLRANEVVLVEDGPLTQSLNAVIDSFQKAYPELKVVLLEKNGGLGRALNIGLENCCNDLVVRCDTDDICKYHRFEKQVSYMEEHPEIDVCSASIEEFIGDVNNLISTRNLPEEHEDLYKFGKKRNPINHPVSIFRKSSVEAVGGYKHFYLFEDYYLWARMMINGAKFHNIKDSLLYFRFSPDMMKRRGGWKYAKTEVNFQYTLYRIGYINLIRMIQNIFIRFGVRLIPNWTRKRIYTKYLRKK